MLMPSITLDTSSAGAPAGEPAAAGTAGVSGGGEAFAGQLALAQSALPTGQNLAASALPLQTLALGPGLEVVTPSAASPDGDSLAEFARAQGLDDDVVAWLFSDATQAQMQAQSLVPLAVPPGVMVMPAAVPGATGADLPDGALPAGTLPGAAVLPGVPAAAADAGLAAALAAVGTAGWLQNQPGTARLSTEATPPLAADPALAATTALSTSLLPTLAASLRGVRPDTGSDTFKLSNAADGMPVEILSLDIQEGLEALWDDADGAGSAGNGAAPQHGGGPALPAPAIAAVQADDGVPDATLAQRAAGYQELSQRLGEALAQRVMSQIERGNWEVRLLLKPARLGEIEIDLSLRSGALDAAFRATNPVTRDLLNDGLPRLREVLANAGMDIAGLNVGSGRSQQTGGNPTPRHAPAPSGAEGSDRSVTAAAPVSQPSRLRNAGESGWDVLV